MFIFYKIPKREPQTPSVQSLLWKVLAKDWKLLNPNGGNLFSRACDSSGQICFQLPSIQCLGKLRASCTATCLVRSRARRNELSLLCAEAVFAPSVLQAQCFETNNNGCWLWSLWRCIIPVMNSDHYIAKRWSRRNRNLRYKNYLQFAILS